jgi:Heterokaryon incompatibility protein (HET)
MTKIPLWMLEGKFKEYYEDSDDSSSSSEDLEEEPKEDHLQSQPSQLFPPLELYPPLEPDQLRLFAVHETEPQLVLSLIVANFERCPRYYAISYYWGEQPTSQIVTCNGNHTIHITPHLEAGIRSACVKMDTSFFWVDAICINQTDDAEKASQVAQMSRIFSTPVVSGVFVWLGVAENDSEGR